MTSRGNRKGLAWPRKWPLEPMAAGVMLLIALAVTWGDLTLAGFGVMLVMLLATWVLTWSPWAALILALLYYAGWVALEVPWASMNLCGLLFVYNWFFHRRRGMWWIAGLYPVVEMVVWVSRFGWSDWGADVLSVTGGSAFAAAAGWLLGRRLDSEVKMRVESETALRSTRLLMASELHDSVAQTQTLVMMNLEDLVDDPMLHEDLAPQVRETLELSRQAARELRAAMAALRAVDQDFMTLGSPAGHSLTQQWNQVRSALGDSGYHAQTRFEVDPSRLSPELEHTISRLLGELVANIVWHGAPGVCNIEVFEQDGAVHIRTVNGIGQGGLRKSGGGGDGLIGICQRVGMLGGTCSYGAQGDTWVAEVRVPVDTVG